MALPVQRIMITGLPVYFERFQHLLLNGGKINAGAVAATETVDLDRHFFTFQSGRNTADEDDHVRIFTD